MAKENELAKKIELLEAKIQKQQFALMRLKRGGAFCEVCLGSGSRMNRNGYFEDCFNCNGVGVTLNQ